MHVGLDSSTSRDTLQSMLIWKCGGVNNKILGERTLRQPREIGLGRGKWLDSEINLAAAVYKKEKAPGYNYMEQA